jgi:hypothetical protein
MLHCELCKKEITEVEAGQASSQLPNTGVVLCLDCVKRTLEAGKDYE